jgi:hypothetical protein
MPETTPLTESTVAIDGALLLHLPPEEKLARVLVPPGQIAPAFMILL